MKKRKNICGYWKIWKGIPRSYFLCRCLDFKYGFLKYICFIVPPVSVLISMPVSCCLMSLNFQSWLTVLYVTLPMVFCVDELFKHRGYSKVFFWSEVYCIYVLVQSFLLEYSATVKWSTSMWFCHPWSKAFLWWKIWSQMVTLRNKPNSFNQHQ